MDAIVTDDRKRRLADDSVLTAGGSRSPAARSRRTAQRLAFATCSAGGGELARKRDKVGETARSLVSICSAAEEKKRTAAPEGDRLDGLRVARDGLANSGAVGAAPKFPPARPSSSCCGGEPVDDGAHAPAWRQAGCTTSRRRLPPLLGRPEVARAALRKDAVRQRTARLLLPARIRRARQGALPRGRGGDDRLHAARALPRRWRLRVGAGRRHRRRGGSDVHLEALRGRTRPAAAPLRTRPLHRARRARR